MKSSESASAPVPLLLAAVSREHLQSIDLSLDFHGRNRLQVAMVEAQLASSTKDANFPTELIDKLQKELTSLEDVSIKELRSLHVRSECVLDTVNTKIQALTRDMATVLKLKEEHGNIPKILVLEQILKGSAEQLMRMLESEKEHLKIAST